MKSNSTTIPGSGYGDSSDTEIKNIEKGVASEELTNYFCLNNLRIQQMANSAHLNKTMDSRNN